MLRGRDALLDNSMLHYPGHVILTTWIFLEIFTSGRYHREMKILKILASNSKRFRDYGIFKIWQIDDDMGGGGKCDNFLDNICLKYPLVLNILLGMFFDSRNSKIPEKGKSNENLLCDIYLSKKVTWDNSWVNIFLVTLF